MSWSPALAGWAEVEGWIIDSSDTGCYLWAEFDGGTSFMIDFDSSVEPMSMDIAIWNTKWRSVQVNEEYQVALEFDNGNRWTVAFFATTFDDGTKVLANYDDASSDSNRKFVKDFIASDGVSLEFNGTPIDTLDISGSRAAFQEMVSCHKSLLKSGDADPFSASDPFE